MKAIQKFKLRVQRGVVQTLEVPANSTHLKLAITDEGFGGRAVEVTVLADPELKATRKFLVASQGDSVEPDDALYIGCASEVSGVRGYDRDYFLFEVFK